jgi:hypothetical protein
MRLTWSASTNYLTFALDNQNEAEQQKVDIHKQKQFIYSSN